MTPSFAPCRPPAPRLYVLALAQAFFSIGACAASDAERIAELEKKLDRSTQMLEQLAARLQQLEGGAQRGAAIAAAAAPALQAQVDALEQHVSAISNRPEPERGLAMHGFADVGWAVAGKGHDSGVRTGALDFYLTPQFGDRVKALIELNVETGGDGHVGVDLERVQVGYTLGQTSTLWVGRFHTPYGYWNTAFHHGAQLQTAVARPRFLEFEDAGGILPAHSVGIWLNGTRKLSAGRVGYDVYVSNAPTIQMADPAQAGSGTLDPGLKGAGGRSASIGGNLSLEFKGAAEGLRVGLHALSAKVFDTATAAAATRLQMLGAWVVYNENDWELMAEQYSFHNRELTGGLVGSHGSHRSNAGYVQLGRQFGLFTPYARFERTALSQVDPYFAQQEAGQSYKRSALGLRYDVNPTTALKFEAMSTQYTDRVVNSFSELRGQLAVRF